MVGDKIPEFRLSPEAAALLRLQYDIDRAEGGVRAPVSGFVYRGVRIESRWAVHAELEAMKRIIDAMPELMAWRLVSIWCDSHCGANYIVHVRTGLWVPDLKLAISDAAAAQKGGHNGVMIFENDTCRAWLDPH